MKFRLIIGVDGLIGGSLYQHLYNSKNRVIGTSRQKGNKVGDHIFLDLRNNLSDWEFQYNNKWFTADVPGNNFSDLLSHKLIPDPFYGTNEDSVQWVSKRDWSYKSEFSATENTLKKQNQIMNGLLIH